MCASLQRIEPRRRAQFCHRVERPRQLLIRCALQGTLGDGLALIALGAGRRDEVMRRCNHCDGQLGLIIHRKWRLRFCSRACKKAYEHKLDEERARLRHLSGRHVGSLIRQAWLGCRAPKYSEGRPRCERHPAENRRRDSLAVPEI